MRNIRNTNVCVIGGAGFLGSHLVDHLVEDRGCKVLVLDNLISGLKKHINSKAILHVEDIANVGNPVFLNTANNSPPDMAFFILPFLSNSIN